MANRDLAADLKFPIFHSKVVAAMVIVTFCREMQAFNRLYLATFLIKF
jgi:hypothetical protein